MAWIVYNNKKQTFFGPFHLEKNASKCYRQLIKEEPRLSEDLIVSEYHEEDGMNIAQWVAWKILTTKDL
ncbi:MAG TPA: hypothetical protein VFM18_17745 [Methanosarcina sp.]|nr:hypothetical protein [Methanosarcina sp.]